MDKKEILKLLGVYFIISVLIFGVTKASKKRFSQELLTKLTLASGKSKQLTTDPCAYSIAGDPNAGASYIRLIIHCRDGGRSLSTFDANAINGGTLEAVISEFHRINGVSAESKRYRCKKDSAAIKLTDSISAPTTIECDYE